MINSDSTFLKIIGASYSIYNINNNADTKKPLKLYDYCLSGFDGAFASKCLGDYVPIVLEYAKPLTDYVVSFSFAESLSEFYYSGRLVDYLLKPFVGVIASAENQELAANEFLKTLASIFRLGQVLPMGIALALVVAAIVYIEKIKQQVANSKLAQLVLAVMISVVTAKVAGYFNATLVNLVYLVVLARRRSDMVKNITDFVVVPFNKEVKKRFNELAEGISKTNINNRDNKILKNPIASGLGGTKNNNDPIQTGMDCVRKSITEKRVNKELDVNSGDSSSSDINTSRTRGATDFPSMTTNNLELDMLKFFSINGIHSFVNNEAQKGQQLRQSATCSEPQILESTSSTKENSKTKKAATKVGALLKKWGKNGT